MKNLKLFCLLLFCVPVINCEAQESDYYDSSSSVWEFVRQSDLPKEILTSSDAFLTQYIRFEDGTGRVPKYIVMEGWENGWDIFIWDDDKWISFTKQNEIWTEDFTIGHFNADDKLDIVLYRSHEESNLYGEAFPAMPRLFFGSSATFKSVETSCSKVLQSYFLSDLSFYKQQKFPEKPTDFLVELVDTEEDLLKRKCTDEG